MLNLAEKQIEKSLPILDYKEQIIETIADSRVTIITAETGAGKSTQVPQFLLEYGLKIVVTEPRRLAARSLARRVAYESNCKLGGLIGYRTAFERYDSEDTRCLFVTDGLELVRELHQINQPDVLIIDEAHEWNINIETLVAWSKMQLKQNPNFKVVIMSATLEADKLSEYFGHAPIIDVPGQLFPIEETQPNFPKIEDEVADLVHQGRNVLVFQPGKKEIAQTIKDLKTMGLQAIILPLHGELEPEEQDKVFQRYHLPKVIVATNIAQTSVTIDDIDAVVDSGLERRIETVDGIEGLYLKSTSKADDIQRKGRAGRCKPGIYVNYCGELEKQSDFPKAEIQRVRLDQLVLRLAIIGFDATELEFFHQPDREAIIEAKRALHALGAMDQDERVSPIGREMANLPISVNFARMIVEAIKLNAVGEVITIAACMEVNGIHLQKGYNWQHLVRGIKSDLLVQLQLFNEACKMSGNEELRENDIMPKAFYRAKEIRQKLAETLINIARAKRTFINLNSSAKPEEIIRSCVAGLVDHLYHQKFIYYSNGDSKQRTINKHSMISRAAEWVVGLPLDLEIPTGFGAKRILNLLTMATEVDPKLLAEIAPQLVSQRKEFSTTGIGRSICVKNITTFNGVDLPECKEITISWPEAITHLPKGMTPEELRQELIDEQFKKARNYGGVIQDQRVEHSGHYRPEFKPVCYGSDPMTGEQLYAFPSIEPGSIFGLNITYHKTFAEAKKSSAEVIGSGSEKGYAFRIEETKTKIQQPSRQAFLPETNVGIWKQLDNKWWQCPNGHAVRVPKKATEITCSICKLKHKLN